MKRKYIEPLAETYLVCVENVLVQDSNGTDRPEDVDANTSSFDEGEMSSSKGLWED